MTKIRVLVVEDSLTVRRVICDALNASSDLQVVGEAGDGKSAIEKCETLRPDVITLDMMLPVMTGMAATEYIMAHCPTPILIVSSSTNRGELYRTYDALAAGAVDVLEKPKGDEGLGVWEDKLRAAVRLVSRIRVITHLRARLRSLPRAMPMASPSGAPVLIAIGASTGGPGALIDILRAIPQGFALPLLMVLHINEPFGSAFADWLDAQTHHRVRYATHGEAIADLKGHAILAPPGKHLVVRDGRLWLTMDAERHSCRPSVDVLFESLAQSIGQRVCACLLTGMGRDGAAGLLALRDSGALTIAQDEASCVVYGMPREAVLLNAAQRVLPLSEIGPSLAALNAAVVS